MSKDSFTGYVIHPDGSCSEMPEPGSPNGFTLDQLQGAVGGYIEPVRSDLPGKVFLADEEGLLKDLRQNPVGSFLVGRPIVGPLVVIPEELFR